MNSTTAAAQSTTDKVIDPQNGGDELVEATVLNLNDEVHYQGLEVLVFEDAELKKLAENVNTPRHFYDVLHSQPVSDLLHSLYSKFWGLLEGRATAEQAEEFFKIALRKALVLKSSNGKRVQIMVKASIFSGMNISFYPKWIARNKTQFPGTEAPTSEAPKSDEPAEVVDKSTKPAAKKPAAVKKTPATKKATTKKPDAAAE